MLPRMVVRVRRAVRRLSRPEALAPSGADNQASWQLMLARIDAREREIERRLQSAEQALNRLG